MIDCAYCGETFDDEEAYLDHLRDAHEGELSRIDRRRVESTRSDERSKIVTYGVIAVVVIVLSVVGYVTVLGSAGNGSTPIEARPLPDHGNATLLQDVQRFPSQGRDHVPQGTQIDYATAPPTSGPHYLNPVPAGFYTEAPPAGNLVHSLEHGAVVIYYDPAAITPEANESLHAFARNHDERYASVVVVPNPTASPESPYVLTAWRTMLHVDGYDPAVVRAFLAEYLGRGPEHPVR